MALKKEEELGEVLLLLDTWLDKPFLTDHLSLIL